MATYYRWDRNNINWTTEEKQLLFYNQAPYVYNLGNYLTFYYEEDPESITPNSEGIFPATLSRTFLDQNYQRLDIEGENSYVRNPKSPTIVYYGDVGVIVAWDYNNKQLNVNGLGGGGALWQVSSVANPGNFIDNIYNTSSSAYPTNGQSGSYWYNNRTTVTSPTNPSQISYPSTINTLSTTITWQPATSNTSYPVSRYELSYSTNGGSSWQVAGTTAETSYQFGISSPEVTQIQFRVRAMDTNSQYSDYVTGSNSTVQYVPANPPVITLPDNAKLGDTITISWNSVTDATNYILQRKVDGGEWTQIYSGAELSTTNLIDNLGISYRIAFNVGSNFTSEWSQEYRLNTYEKLIEMTYLGEDGNYMPLYPRTISNAVVNASDLINTVSLSGTYQGNGIESNTVLLNIKEGIEPKIAFVSNTEGNVEIVNNFDSKGNLVVNNNSNVAGEEYSYVVIGKKED